jgi:nucleotidyltransferase/DNA polymerase involved in DNA repair
MPPERTIFLIDGQSFYASVEKAAHPEYKNLPVGVAGDVIIRPRMQTYITVSLLITEIFESFTELVEPYSIDVLLLTC